MSWNGTEYLLESSRVFTSFNKCSYSIIYYSSTNAFKLIKPVVRWFLEVQKSLEAIHFIAIPTIKYYCIYNGSTYNDIYNSCNIHIRIVVGLLLLLLLLLF